eukprot:5786305-Prymnesium_polylepis.1
MPNCETLKGGTLPVHAETLGRRRAASAAAPECVCESPSGVGPSRQRRLMLMCHTGANTFGTSVVECLAVM